MAAAIALVLVLGVALAVARPGNLGDHTSTNDAATTSSTAALTTSTTAASTTSAPATSTTVTTTTAVTPTTAAAGGGGRPSTTTTTPASGLGTSGAGSAGQRGLATTGGVPWAVPGMLVLVAALAVRRFSLR